MDIEAEELQLLGIGGETFDILLQTTRNKLVRTFPLTFLLPLSFATVAMCLMSGPVLIPESIVYLDFIVDNNGTLPARTLQSRVLQQPRTANIVFAFEFWMLSTSAVFYTAASIYMADKASYAKAMTVVPMVWKRLGLTLLWFFTIALAYITAYILALFLVMYTAGFHKYVNSEEFLFDSIPIPAVFFYVLVYINLVGYLAGVISLLQEKYYGMAAMRKRKQVIKRKRTTVLVLLMLYFIFIQGSGGIFGFAVAELERHRGVLIGARAVNGTLLTGLLCLVMLWGLLMQSEL